MLGGTGARQHGHELLTSDVGYYHPSHLRMGAPDLSKRRFDGGVRIAGTRVATSEECDGAHHFVDVEYHSTTAVKNQLIDGAKVRSGLMVGEWNVRYHQEGMWTGGYQWKTFMRSAHDYIARHCDGNPKVILPDYYRPEYTQWLTGAGIEKGDIVWL